MRYITALLILILTAGSQGQQQPSRPDGNRHLPIECDHAAPPRGTHWVCNDPNNSCNCRLENDNPGHPTLEDDDGQLIHKPEPPNAGKISTDDFYKIMNAVAEGQSEGNTANAADMFAENAVYSDLLRRQTYKGRVAIKKSFSNSSAKSLKMQWRHLLFNEQDQIGAGEFTLEGDRRYHGMVIVKVEKGKISNWREYRYASSQSWDKFTSDNPF
jgi:hypothetical protein